jgi:glycosyl transferase family 1
VKVLFVTTTRYDYTTATLVQGLNALSAVELRTTTAGNYARAEQVLQREDARAFGRSATLLILGYNRGVDTDLYWSIDNPRAIRIFVDGGDNSELPISLKRARAIHAIFKREYLREENSIRNLTALLTRRSVGMWDTTRRHAFVPFPAFEGFRNRTRPIDFLRNVAARPIVHKVYPLPYGIEDRFRGSVNPRPAYELSCLLNCHAPERAEFVRQLRELQLPATYIGETPIGQEDVQRLVALGAVNPAATRRVELGHNPLYYQQIRDSRRSVSVPGAGFDTLRFWEILAQGALLVSKRIGIEMPDPLLEGTHYLAFDTFAELRDVLQRSFADPASADRIRQSGHDFAMRFHTAQSRAMYVLKTLADLGLITPVGRQG